jgi:hypothetical protein
MKKIINLIVKPQNNTIAQYIMGIGCIISIIMAVSALFVPFVRDSKYVPNIAILLVIYLVYAIYYIVCTTINDIKTTQSINRQAEIDLISTIFSWEKINNIPIDKAYKTQIRGALKDIIGMYSNRSSDTLENELENDSMIADCEIALSNLRYL